MTRRTRCARAWIAWSSLVLVGIDAAAAGTPDEPARVLAQLRMGAPERFVDGLTSLYAAIGFGDLVDVTRIRERLWADVPLASLDGVDPTRPLGHLLVWSDAGLERVPFCGVRDLGRIEVALAGTPWHVRQRGGEVYFAARSSLLDAIDRDVEGGAWDAGPALELDVDVGAIRDVGSTAIRRVTAMLRGVARMAELLGRDSAVPRRGARWIDVALRALSEWRSFGVAVWFEPERLRIRGRLRPEQGSMTAEWVASAKALPTSPIALLPATAPVAVEVHGSPSALAQLAGAIFEWDEGAVVRRVIEESTGELGIALLDGGNRWLAAAVDATTIRARVPELRIEPEGPRSTDTSASTVSCRLLGNWIELTFGAGAVSRAAGEDSSTVPRERPSPPRSAPVLRFHASLPAVAYFVRSAWDDGIRDPAPVTESELSGVATVEQRALLIECELPWRHIRECIPRWR